jgi:hypothetical protein
MYIISTSTRRVSYLHHNMYRAASRGYLLTVSALNRVAALGTRTLAFSSPVHSAKSKPKSRRTGSPKGLTVDASPLEQQQIKPKLDPNTSAVTSLLLSFRSLETLFPNLVVLEIKRVPLLTSGIFGMDGVPTRLIRLNLCDIGQIDPHWSTLASSGTAFPSVNHLECARIGGFGDALISFVLCFPSLSHLEVRDCFPIENADIPLFCSSLSHLTSLVISECMQVSQVDVRLRPSLTHLSVTRCPTLRAVKTGTNLLFCSFEGSSIRASIVEDISKYCSDLIHLNLRGCRSIASLFLRSGSLAQLNVLGCTSMKKLAVVAPVLCDIDLLCCAAIESLSIYSAMLGKLNLAMLQSLTTLELKCASLRQINLSGCCSLEYFGLPSIDVDAELGPGGADGGPEPMSGAQRLVRPDQLLQGCPLLDVSDDAVFVATPMYKNTP